MDRIYVDTCVYLDLFKGRKDKYRDLGAFALRVFNMVREKQYMLVISDWVLDELKGKTKKIDEFLEQFDRESLLRIERTRDDEIEARKLSRNWPDALHVVLAVKENCVYLVTHNVDDFTEFTEYIDIIEPQSL